MTTLRPNPELWRAHRQELTDPWVGPGAGRNRPMVERVAKELVDRWIDRGAVEFVSEFAQPLPHTVMANILGWPLADLKLLKYFGDGTVKPFVYGAGHNNILTEEDEPEPVPGARGIQAVHGRPDPRQTQGTPGRHDFLSHPGGVLAAQSAKLKDLEINGIVYAMVIGGLETTQYALAEQAQLLIERWHLGYAEGGPRQGAGVYRGGACACARRPRVCPPALPVRTRYSRACLCRRAATCTCAGRRQYRPGGVAGAPGTEARPPGGHPAPDVLPGAKGLPGGAPVAPRTDGCMEYAARPRRPVCLRGRQRLFASTGHHAGNFETQSDLYPGVIATTAGHSTGPFCAALLFGLWALAVQGAPSDTCETGAFALRADYPGARASTCRGTGCAAA